MTELIPHPSGITREPPQPTSGGLPDLPEPTVYGNGRIGWPSIVQYDVTLPDGVEIRDYPPNTKEPPTQTVAILIEGKGVQSRGFTEDRTAPYRIIVHDLPRYDRLKAEGWVRDPRHTGFETEEMVDNRKAPGA